MGFMDDLQKAIGLTPSGSGKTMNTAPVKVISTKDEGATEALNDIKTILLHMVAQSRESEPTGEMLTIADGDKLSYDSHGFRYNAIVVSDTDAGKTTLTVNVGGVQFTQNLTAGLNQVNFPHGADIAPSARFTFYLMRSNFEYKSS